MPTVTETLVLPDGTPPVRAKVFVRLVVPGYTDDDRTVLGSQRITVDEDGAWEADLEANVNITPANTHYLVSRLGSEVLIVVPDTAGPHQLQDLLVDAPADLDTNALAVHIAQVGEGAGHLPAVGVGDAGKVPAVNEDEDGYELVQAAHPNLAAHDAMGLATDQELTDLADLVDAALAGKADSGHDHDADYEAAGAVAAHAAAGNPHPTYLTQAEGDAAYDAAGTATDAVADHEGAADPHPGYLTAAEGNAAYEASGAVATHTADTTAVHGIADTANLLDTADIGVSVQAHSAVLDATTAAFTTADETKLDGIEAGADVTDAANVDAAGAIMKTIVDAAGDLIVGTGADTVGRLAKGNALDVVRVNAAGTALEMAAVSATLRVEDEGGTVVAAATGMNFAGAGVHVTDAGSNEALVTIPVALLASAESSSSGTTTSDTLVLMNASLVCSGTVPASGSLIISIVALANNNAAGRLVYFGLLDGADAVVAGSEWPVADNNQLKTATYRRKITGLTPGAAFTYKAAFRDSHGSGSAGWQNATMEVWAV